jgi:DNA/RNA endonuclease YhcR with UshA esterase domain
VFITRFATCALLAFLLLSAGTADAHHSTAEFDMNRTVSVKGTVTAFEWSNPHAYIHLEAKDEKGNVEEWTAELASLGMLARIAWKRDTVKPGDQITIVGSPAKNGKLYVRLDKIVFANGQELSAKVG